MARPLRIAYAGAVYHVTSRGNARQRIVRDDEDRKRFIRILADMVEQHRVLCHAWVLMNNHYHLLLETPHANLSPAIRHLNGTYSRPLTGGTGGSATYFRAASKRSWWIEKATCSNCAAT